MSKYNQFPESWREISNEEFTRAFFHYCLEPLDHRQMCRDKEGKPLYMMTNANLFTIQGTKKQFPDDGLGVALVQDRYTTKFVKFGKEEDWKQFESAFAAQFRGDNS